MFVKAQLKNRNFYAMILMDICIFIITLFLSYFFRFDFVLTQVDMKQITNLLLWMVPLKTMIFFLFGLYSGMWRYTGVRDFWKLAQACVVSTILVMTVSYTHLRAHETVLDLVCRLLLEKNN